MDTIWIMLGWVGIYGPLALAAVGSIVGCTRAGQAACGAMIDVESGYGRLIGLSLLPASNSIYGIVITFSLNRDVNVENAPALVALGVLSGLAIMFAGFFQGQCCASAIHASKSKPEIFGLSATPAAVVEGFAVFAFVFALVVAAGIPAPAN